MSNSSRIASSRLTAANESHSPLSAGRTCSISPEYSGKTARKHFARRTFTLSILRVLCSKQVLTLRESNNNNRFDPTFRRFPRSRTLLEPNCTSKDRRRKKNPSGTTFPAAKIFCRECKTRACGLFAYAKNLIYAARPTTLAAADPGKATIGLPTPAPVSPDRSGRAKRPPDPCCRQVPIDTREETFRPIHALRSRIDADRLRWRPSHSPRLGTARSTTVCPQRRQSDPSFGARTRKRR